MGTDRRQNLDTVALFASMPVRSALQAVYVRFAAEAFFRKYGETWFRTNPANCLPYHALRALEAEALVHLAELLKDEHNLHPIDAEIVGKHLLPLHRDMISHPWTVKWRGQNRQRFNDDGQKFSDVRTGLVWSVAKNFDTALAQAGLERRLAVIPVTMEMAQTLSLIFRLTLKEGVAVPEANDLFYYLQVQLSGIVAVLERYPDGTDCADRAEADAPP